MVKIIVNITYLLRPQQDWKSWTGLVAASIAIVSFVWPGFSTAAHHSAIAMIANHGSAGGAPRWQATSFTPQTRDTTGWYTDSVTVSYLPSRSKYDYTTYTPSMYDYTTYTPG